MSALPKPSEQIRKVLDDLAPHAAAAGVFDIEIEGAEFIRLLKIIEAIGDECAKMELELAIFRDSEAGRALCDRIEQTATDQLAAMLPAEGTIIRPDFRRKS